MSQSQSPIILTHEQQQSMMRFERTWSGMRSPHSGGAIAYAGTSGSYAEEAALCFFGTDSLCIAHKTFEDVLKSITGGGCDYGVLPIENTSTGSITAVYDLLAKYRAAIVGEISIAIRHCLLGNPGAALSDIKSVYSHEQGFAQSQAFLARYPQWLHVAYHNTAIAAKMVHESGDCRKAAIASRRAAKIHGLQILAADINSSNLNTTRFVIISQKAERRPHCNKISLMFQLPHTEGALYHLLGIFNAYHLNMTKIESRPIPDTQWRYRFFLDFIGLTNEAELPELMRQVMGATQSFYFLGNYPANPDVH